MKLRDYINHLKELHHELNKRQEPYQRNEGQKLISRTKYSITT